MESPYSELPEIPSDFQGKIKLLGEQLDIFLGVVRGALEGPLREGDSPEKQMLEGATKDLGELAPALLAAFGDVRELHLQVAKDGLKAVEEFPARLRAMDEQLAKDLAPFAAENFIPKPPEPLPAFLEILDIGKALREVGELLKEDQPDGPASTVLHTTGNIWENWKPRPQSPKNQVDPVVPGYRFPTDLLQSLGLEAEPEKPTKPGGNIWEKWPS